MLEFDKVKGYEELPEEDKVNFKKFTENLKKVCSGEYIENLTPIAVYRAEETESISKENNEDDYYVSVKNIVKAVNCEGKKAVKHRCINKEYSHLKVLETSTKTYLRFEYKNGKTKSWLHIIKDGAEWY